ncbi:hypothetical protein QNO07_18295 [Streptomyces sp. 549]|uniref:hypothetical protein n=1 Tax=Streptomyces sp. 549 TaxID=3049076 RepID=UPI0024C3D097|nr:hypothetical protein [Streptomyces sp. 549]MDK1475345.1 hypothetical protein [Streptomyces sp. 549]
MSVLPVPGRPGALTAAEANPARNSRPGPPPAMARLCALEDDRFRSYCLLRLMREAARSEHSQHGQPRHQPTG